MRDSKNEFLYSVWKASDLHATAWYYLHGQSIPARVSSIFAKSTEPRRYQKNVWEWICISQYDFGVLGFPGIEGNFKVREFRVWLGELVWYPGTIDFIFNGSVASSWIHENNEMVSVLLDTRADDWHQKVPSYSSIECQIFDIILAPIGVSP